MNPPLRPAGRRTEAFPDVALASCWVLAGPFRAHVRQLLAATGLPWRVLAIAAGVPSGVVESLLHRPHARIRRCDAVALMGWNLTRVRMLSLTPVDSDTTRRRVQALLTRGHDPRLVAEWLLLPRTRLLALAEGGIPLVSQMTAIRAAAACQVHGPAAWWDTDDAELTDAGLTALAA